MGRLMFLVIACTSFLVVVGETILKKFLSLSLCALFGFDVLVCPVSFNNISAQATLPLNSTESTNVSPSLVSQRTGISNRCPQGTRVIFVGETEQFRVAICRGSAGEYYLGEDKDNRLGSITLKYKPGDPNYSYRRGQNIYRLRQVGGRVHLEVLEGSKVLTSQPLINVKDDRPSTTQTSDRSGNNPYQLDCNMREKATQYSQLERQEAEKLCTQILGILVKLDSYRQNFATKGDFTDLFAVAYYNVTAEELKRIMSGDFKYPNEKMKQMLAFFDAYEYNRQKWVSGNLNEVEEHWLGYYRKAKQANTSIWGCIFSPLVDLALPLPARWSDITLSDASYFFLNVRTVLNAGADAHVNYDLSRAIRGSLNQGLSSAMERELFKEFYDTRVTLQNSGKTTAQELFRYPGLANWLDRQRDWWLIPGKSQLTAVLEDREEAWKDAVDFDEALPVDLPIPAADRSELTKLGKSLSQRSRPIPPLAAIDDSLIPKTCGISTVFGDPHLITFDGGRLSFQAVGEFIQTKSSDGKFEVQGRYKQVGPNASLVDAIAIKLGQDRVGIYAQQNPPLRVNGKSVTVEDSLLNLDGGGQIYRDGSTYMIISPSGEGVRVQRISAGGGSLTFEMTMPKSRQNQVSGLLGNFNGDSSDDIKTRSGEVLPSNPNYEQLYKVFGNSWRVSQKESLFDYARGETTATFTDLSFPTKIVRTSDFPSNRRAEAERTCREAGVREPQLLEACMFDILATGDNQFAQVSANLEQKLASDVEAAPDEELAIPPRQDPISYATNFSEVRTLTGHSGVVFSVAISPDRQTMVSGSGDNTIKVWNLATGSLKATLTGHSNGVEYVVISPDGQTIVSGSADKTIKVWDLATGSLKATLTGHSNAVISVAISPDGQTIVSGSGDGLIKVWDLATGSLKATLTGHSDAVLSVTISPDGQTVVSGNDDKTIKVWNLATGSLKATLTGHSDASISVAISPDGQTIISGGQDTNAKIWDLATGDLKTNLTGHKGVVLAVAISPDGQTIVSGSGDNTIKVWDLATGSLKANLTGHSDWVSSVAISPDGQTIVSGGWDNIIKIWRASGRAEIPPAPSRSQKLGQPQTRRERQSETSQTSSNVLVSLDGKLKVRQLRSYQEACATGKPSHSYQLQDSASGFLYPSECNKALGNDALEYKFVDTSGNERCRGKAVIGFGGIYGGGAKAVTYWEIQDKASSDSNCSTKGETYKIRMR
ncbi:MAG: VWD domain-containing protein [Microcoleaceae cyanobacterium]